MSGLEIKYTQFTESTLQMRQLPAIFLKAKFVYTLSALGIFVHNKNPTWLNTISTAADQKRLETFVVEFHQQGQDIRHQPD